MATVTEIVDGLERRLQSVAGLRVYDFIPESLPGGHCAVIAPPEVSDYVAAMRGGLYTLELDVLLLIEGTVDRVRKTLLPYQDYEGSLSIPAAVRADRTLGLDNTDALVRTSRPLNAEEVAGYQHFGIAFAVTIASKGS